MFFSQSFEIKMSPSENKFFCIESQKVTLLRQEKAQFSTPSKICIDRRYTFALSILFRVLRNRCALGLVSTAFGCLLFDNWMLLGWGREDSTVFS